MLLLRFVAIFAALGIAAGVLAWMATGDRRYLTYSWRIGKGALILALAAMALLAAERLIVL